MSQSDIKKVLEKLEELQRQVEDLQRRPVIYPMSYIPVQPPVAPPPSTPQPWITWCREDPSKYYL